MNQQSLNAYLNLIQKLLNCPKGEEWTLLQQHENLVTPDLLQVMEQVASELAAEGNLQAAKFLRHWEAQLAHVLSPSPQPHKSEDRSQAYLELIQALLDCPKGSEAEVLAANQSLLDLGLVQVMRQVAAQMAAQGNHQTANFLGNLAAELHHSLVPPHGERLRQAPEEKETPTPTEQQQKQLEQLNELLSQLQEKPTTPEPFLIQERIPEPVPKPSRNVTEAETILKPAPTTQPLPSPLDISSIHERLAAIAQSLAKLADMLASRLPVPNPLWRMESLERACAANWVVTTEELEQLIGVKPQCQAGESTFQRGCWIFIKAGKTGSQTAWRVTKATVE
jgi:hypothetical protein